MANILDYSKSPSVKLFEKIYRKTYRSLNEEEKIALKEKIYMLPGYEDKATRKNDAEITLYVRFMFNAYEALQIDKPNTINIWELEQNQNQSIYNGRESLKSFCSARFFELCNCYDCL